MYNTQFHSLNDFAYVLLNKMTLSKLYLDHMKNRTKRFGKVHILRWKTLERQSEDIRSTYLLLRGSPANRTVPADNVGWRSSTHCQTTLPFSHIQGIATNFRSTSQTAQVGYGVFLL